MLFKSLSDEPLKSEYWNQRQLLDNWNKMATPGHGARVRSKIAGGVFKCLKNIDIIVAIARQRKVKL